MINKTLLERSQEIRLILRENMEFWRKEIIRNNDTQSIINFKLYKKDLKIIDLEIERIKNK